MEEVDRIECEDDDGNRYTVLVLQQFHSRVTLKGARERFGGQKKLMLSDGRHVNTRDNEGKTFQIFETGRIIRRV